MSIDKNKSEALRWLDTALDDHDAAKIMKDNNKFAQACFLCQQSSEKALKALYYFFDEDPWGHSIIRLIDGLEQISPETHAEFNCFIKDAQILDRYYIPTRYPNGLPGITPSQAFNADDADRGLDIAGKIIESVRQVIA